MLKRPVKQISCKEAIKRVFDFVDNHLTGKSRAELEHHLNTCRHCFDRVEFERLIKSRLRKLKISVDADVLHERVNEIIDQF